MKAQNKKITVAEYIVSYIVSLGVDMVPLIQGGAIMKVIDFVGQNKKLRYLPCNHEQAVAMMVDAYARIKGFGVGLATSGPGGTNMATGIACAYYDSIPCLFITGQVGMFHVKGARRVRQRGFQETDIVSMMKPITKYAMMVQRSEDVRYIFEKGVYLAKSGRPGPVLIDVPYNVQRELVDPRTLKGYVPDMGDSAAVRPSEKEIREICKELTSAKRPVLLFGGGVRISNQTDNVIRLTRLLQIPFISTWGAVDIFPSDNPLYMGSPGRYGNVSANEIATASDVILALGTRFSTKVVHNGMIFSKNTRVIAVDIDRGELEDGLISPTRKVVADLSAFIPALLRECEHAKKSPNPDLKAWQNHARAAKSTSYKINVPPPKHSHSYVNPYYCISALSEALGKNDILTADCGLNLVLSVQAYQGKGGNQRFISAWGNSPMGYAFPAASGAYFARPNAKIVCLIGDGGMQMNIQELQTVVVNKIPVKIFILNNYCYGMMVLNKPEFEGRSFGNDPTSGYEAPDFLKIARAYGIPAFNFLNEKNLKTNIKKVLAMKGPVLVNINLHPDQNIFDNVVLPAKTASRVH